MEISRYKPEDERALLAAIQQDPQWAMFTQETAIENYKISLRRNLVYVCHDRGEFCGYVRAILDEHFAVYVSELFVVPAFRNRGIGRTLIAQLKKDFSELLVYVLSDEDAYYEKLGYQKVGSVFAVHPPEETP